MVPGDGLIFLEKIRTAIAGPQGGGHGRPEYFNSHASVGGSSPISKSTEVHKKGNSNNQEMVPGDGLEPSRSIERGILNPLCLPIPPPGLGIVFL